MRSSPSRTSHPRRAFPAQVLRTSPTFDTLSTSRPLVPAQRPTSTPDPNVQRPTAGPQRPKFGSPHVAPLSLPVRMGTPTWKKAKGLWIRPSLKPRSGGGVCPCQVPCRPVAHSELTSLRMPSRPPWRHLAPAQSTPKCSRCVHVHPPRACGGVLRAWWCSFVGAGTKAAGSGRSSAETEGIYCFSF